MSTWFVFVIPVLHLPPAIRFFLEKNIFSCFTIIIEYSRVSATSTKTVHKYCIISVIYILYFIAQIVLNVIITFFSFACSFAVEFHQPTSNQLIFTTVINVPDLARSCTHLKNFTISRRNLQFALDLPLTCRKTDPEFIKSQ